MVILILALLAIILTFLMVKNFTPKKLIWSSKIEIHWNLNLVSNWNLVNSRLDTWTKTGCVLIRTSRKTTNILPQLFIIILIRLFCGKNWQLLWRTFIKTMSIIENNAQGLVKKYKWKYLKFIESHATWQLI